MLKPKKKLKVTRKDLKEDQFVLSVFKVQEFLTNHVKPIFIVVVAVIVVVALFTYISKDKAQRNMVASKMLVEASHYMEMGDEVTAIAKLDTISDMFEDTYVSELANINVEVISADSFICGLYISGKSVCWGSEKESYLQMTVPSLSSCSLR